MTKIILASRSPRRKRLLAGAGIPFRVAPSSADERTRLRRPYAIVKSLALRKAVEVARRYPGHPVIGADTIVVCKGKTLGKPRNRKDALRLLNIQNGSWQSVYTGVALVWRARGKMLAGYAVSRCKAMKLARKELLSLAGKHMDKAGAYAVQDSSDAFIEKIKGRFDNVVGFPMDLVKRLLKKSGWRGACPSKNCSVS